MTLAEQVLHLRWRGYPVSAIRKTLNLDRQAVWSLLQQARVLNRFRVEDAPLQPISSDLLSAIEELRNDRCHYVELDVEDPAARPCGRPVCTVHLVRGRNRLTRRSSWCSGHHAVVYSDLLLPDVRRFIV